MKKPNIKPLRIAIDSLASTVGDMDTLIQPEKLIDNFASLTGTVTELEQEIDALYAEFENRNKLNDLRQFVQATWESKKAIKTELQALSNGELIQLILQYDTSFSTAQKAYRALQRIDIKTWKDLDFLT